MRFLCITKRPLEESRHRILAFHLTMSGQPSKTPRNETTPAPLEATPAKRLCTVRIPSSRIVELWKKVIDLNKTLRGEKKDLHTDPALSLFECLRLCIMQTGDVSDNVPTVEQMIRGLHHLPDKMLNEAYGQLLMETNNDCYTSRFMLDDDSSAPIMCQETIHALADLTISLMQKSPVSRAQVLIVCDFARLANDTDFCMMVTPSILQKFAVRLGKFNEHALCKDKDDWQDAIDLLSKSLYDYVFEYHHVHVLDADSFKFAEFESMVSTITTLLHVSIFGNPSCSCELNKPDSKRIQTLTVDSHAIGLQLFLYVKVVNNKHLSESLEVVDQINRQSFLETIADVFKMCKASLMVVEKSEQIYTDTEIADVKLPTGNCSWFFDISIPCQIINNVLAVMRHMPQSIVDLYKTDRESETFKHLTELLKMDVFQKACADFGEFGQEVLDLYK